MNQLMIHDQFKTLLKHIFSFSFSFCLQTWWKLFPVWVDWKTSFNSLDILQSQSQQHHFKDLDSQ